MAALDPSNSSIGHGHFREGPDDDHEDSRLPSDIIEFSGKLRKRSFELVDRKCQITLQAFWTQNMRGEEEFKRTDSMLEGLVAG